MSYIYSTDCPQCGEVDAIVVNVSIYEEEYGPTGFNYRTGNVTFSTRAAAEAVDWKYLCPCKHSEAFLDEVEKAAEKHAINSISYDRSYYGN